MASALEFVGYTRVENSDESLRLLLASLLPTIYESTQISDRTARPSLRTLPRCVHSSRALRRYFRFL
jgi:hypothetical protein